MALCRVHSKAVHVTYCSHLRCFTSDDEDDVLELNFHEDMLVHDGKDYGDWEIVEESERSLQAVEFHPSLYKCHFPVRSGSA